MNPHKPLMFPQSPVSLYTSVIVQLDRAALPLRPHPFDDTTIGHPDCDYRVVTFFERSHAANAEAALTIKQAGHVGAIDFVQRKQRVRWFGLPAKGSLARIPATVSLPLPCQVLHTGSIVK